jgi:hypothetical protein
VVDSLKYHSGLPCPTLLRHAVRSPLKRPHGCFEGWPSSTLLDAPRRTPMKGVWHKKKKSKPKHWKFAAENLGYFRLDEAKKINHSTKGIDTEHWHITGHWPVWTSEKGHWIGYRVSMTLRFSLTSLGWNSKSFSNLILMNDFLKQCFIFPRVWD